MKKFAILLSLIMIVALAAPAATAQRSDPADPEPSSEQTLDPGPEPLTEHDHDQGLERNTYPDGFVDYSHGPDPHRPDTRAASAAPIPESRPICATGTRFRVVYAYTTSPQNHIAGPGIRTAVDRLNGFFRDYAQRRGSDGRFRFACTSSGLVAIGQARISSCDDYTSAVQGVRSRGFNNSNEKYLIFCSDSNSPWGGQASIRNDDRNTFSNQNNFGPSYAIIYNRGHSGYETRWRTALHEMSHTLGAVQHSAPDASGLWHCDGHLHEDIMCYNDGGPKWDSNHSCTPFLPHGEEAKFDRCGNDYFDPRNLHPYVRSHWQIGSCHLHNRWIAYAHC